MSESRKAPTIHDLISRWRSWRRSILEFFCEEVIPHLVTPEHLECVKACIAHADKYHSLTHASTYASDAVLRSLVANNDMCARVSLAGRAWLAKNETPSTYPAVVPACGPRWEVRKVPNLDFWGIYSLTDSSSSGWYMLFCYKEDANAYCAWRNATDPAPLPVYYVSPDVNMRGEWEVLRRLPAPHKVATFQNRQAAVDWAASQNRP